MLVHSGPESFLQCCCKGSIDVHLGAFDILMLSHYQIKNATFFSIFRFAVEESFWQFASDDGVSSSMETS